MLNAKRSNAFVFSAISLLFAIFLVFFSTLGHDWVFDDSANFLENEKWRGLNAATLEWMWTTSHMGHFIPITWMTLGFDYELWGLDPFGFRLSNLVWHWLASLAFLVLLRKILLIGLPSLSETYPNYLNYAVFVATLFFAIHPMRVESVVWITERRDMVSGFFLLLTVIFYLSYVQANLLKSKLTYSLLGLLAYGLSLGAKPIGLTLPALLLVLDFFPLRRLVPQISPKRMLFLVIEKVPLFLLGAVAAWFAWRSQDIGVDDSYLYPLDSYPPFSRILQVAYGACYYFGSTIIPAGLSPLYLLKPPLALTIWPFWFTFVCFITITTSLIVIARKWPVGVTVWLCYGIIVSPVLGLTQVGPQIVADRYSYLGCLPFVALLGAGVFMIHRCSQSYCKLLCHFLIVFAVIVYGWLAYAYSTHWKNQETLWTKAIAEDPNHYYGFTNRGRYFHDQYILTQDQSYLDSALSDYNRALEIRPTYSVALNNRSVLLMQLGQHAVAMRDLNALIETNPNYTQALYNRARLHIALGNHFEAKQDLSRAIATASPSFYRLQEMKDLLASIEVSSGAN